MTEASGLPTNMSAVALIGALSRDMSDLISRLGWPLGLYKT